MSGDESRLPKVSYLQRGAKQYPAPLIEYLNDRAPTSVALRGDPALWFQRTAPLLSLFCSSKAPGAVILQVHDLAQEWRTQGPTVIGGFHSPVEREALEVLLRGPRPVIVCPARGLEGMRLKPAYKAPLAEGRLLLLSPFGASVRRVTVQTAWERNLFVAALADEVLIAHAHPGSKTAALAQEIVGWGKPVYVLNHPENNHLLAAGARAFGPVT
jgi:predicted Rossmann fold nucleotide-binding protein DprA/Smf involved in DNA uptake